jgi:hypothetical protein
VANNTTANQVTPMSIAVPNAAGGGISIVKARLRKSGTGVTNAAFRLHVFDGQPAVSNGDNGAFLPDHAANWLGSLDVGSMVAFSDGAAGNGAPTVGSAINIAAGAATLYCLMEARGAYTPTSAEQFTWSLEIAKG